MRPAQALILATLTVLPLTLPGCDPTADDVITPREEHDELAPAPEPGADSSHYELVGATAPRPCGHLTATQGQWGASCDDHEIGCLRDDQFMGVFPEGLIVGCGVLTANLVSSAAIEHALPSHGAARPLHEAEAGAYDGSGDPEVGTSLFGHTVALALNVGLDDITAEDGDDVPLEALILGDPWSPCEGMSVGEVLEQANLALGDCPTKLSAATLNGCAQAINKSYANGQTCSSLFQLPAPPPQ